MLYQHVFLLVVYSASTLTTTSGWDIPSTNQYHIQTDEGPERYFRYQTDSGQYRKEKRLEDGTVVGTYAWIDDNGFLLQRDYIADNAGYRILKTKNVYVGRNVPVGQAVKAAKKYPSSPDGYLSYSKTPVPSTQYHTASSYTPNSIQATTPSSVVSSTSRPFGERVAISSTPANIVTSTEPPIVEITPNSVYTTNNNNYISSTPSPFEISSLLPPYYQSTVSPTVPSRNYIPAPQTNYGDYNDVSKEVNDNSLKYNPYLSQGDHSYRFHNGPTYPIGRNGKPYFGQTANKNIQGYSGYDGESVTNDGFRYYIPRAYHEEKTLPGDERTGSFGYIDPFGIRRVIYYNTSPGSGFQHRKNNRYVGFDATPYDPRPY